MRALLLLCLVSGAAAAQVTVQEYKVPSGHGVHDVWADAQPGGPVWISAQGSGNLGILDPKSGRFEFVGGVPVPGTAMAGPFQWLMLEVCRRLDESRAAAATA